MNALVRDPGQP